MVKIVFDFLDLLSPASKEAYKKCICNRFESLAQSTKSLSLENELSQFAARTQDMNRNGYYKDRFDLIREYAVHGGLKNKQNPFTAGSKLVRDYLYNLDEAIQDFLHLDLTSDAPIVRCLLSLHELPDCSLWVLTKETTAFCSTLLRILPASPFFESVTRIWRILDIFEADSDRRVIASYDSLCSRMGALGHEAIVRVSESKIDVEDAAEYGWVGIHLVSSHLNREASVEQFSPLLLRKIQQQQQQNQQEEQCENNIGHEDTLDSECVTCARPMVNFASASFDSSSTNNNINGAAAQKKGAYATAKGISSLGYVILLNVPELADNVKASAESLTTPLLLFREQSQTFRKNFCFCKCFWTGVGAGVVSAVGAVTAFAGISLIVITTIRSFSIAVRNSKK